MFTVGSVGRHYRSALDRRYRSSLGRYVGQVAVDTRLTYQPSVGRRSAKCWSSIGRYVGRYPSDTRLTSDQYLTDSVGDPSVTYQ